MLYAVLVLCALLLVVVFWPRKPQEIIVEKTLVLPPSEFRIAYALTLNGKFVCATTSVKLVEYVLKNHSDTRVVACAGYRENGRLYVPKYRGIKPVEDTMVLPRSER